MVLYSRFRVSVAWLPHSEYQNDRARGTLVQKYPIVTWILKSRSRTLCAITITLFILGDSIAVYVTLSIKWFCKPVSIFSSLASHSEYQNDRARGTLVQKYPIATWILNSRSRTLCAITITLFILGDSMAVYVTLSIKWFCIAGFDFQMCRLFTMPI